MPAFLKSGSVFAAAATLAATFFVSSPTFAAPEPDRLPGCEAAAVQHAAMARIAAADQGYRGGITISSIDHVSEAGYAMPLGSPLAQRYCTGKATLSNGSRQTVYFRVGEGRGLLGLTWGVQACLPGLDKWHVHDGWCHAIRP